MDAETIKLEFEWVSQNLTGYQYRNEENSIIEKLTSLHDC